MTAMTPSGHVSSRPACAFLGGCIDTPTCHYCGQPNPDPQPADTTTGERIPQQRKAT